MRMGCQLKSIPSSVLPHSTPSWYSVTQCAVRANSTNPTIWHNILYRHRNYIILFHYTKCVNSHLHSETAAQEESPVVYGELHGGAGPGPGSQGGDTVCLYIKYGQKLLSSLLWLWGSAHSSVLTVMSWSGSDSKFTDVFLRVLTVYFHREFDFHACNVNIFLRPKSRYYQASHLGCIRWTLSAGVKTIISMSCEVTCSTVRPSRHTLPSDPRITQHNNINHS